MPTQAEYWNAEAGRGWVEAQEQLDAQLAPCGALAIAAAALQPGEAVLDIGCGCGGTTADLAQEVGERGRVVGIDISAPMLARARERLTVPNVELLLADAATAPLPPGGFDALFSRFGVMFFDDPVGAFAHLRGALAPAGRVALVVWRPLEVNPWVTVPDQAIAGLVEPVPLGGQGEPGPFSLADGDRLRRLLFDAGYTDVDLAAEDLELLIGGGMHATEAAAFSIDHGPLRRALASAPDRVRAVAAERITAALVPYDTEAGVRLGAAMWVVTARVG
jgi:SAM-dependent methyltransferase